MQNKKVQLWALSMAGYNCRIEYIPGTTNTCADLLSRKPDDGVAGEQELLSDNEEVELDVNDTTFEVNVLNSYEFEPKEFAKCDGPIDDPLEKPEDCFPELDMMKEQAKDDELLELKTILVHGDPGKEIQRKHITIENILYYLSDPNNDPILRLYVPKHLRNAVVK